MASIEWPNLRTVTEESYICGYCSYEVAPGFGYPGPDHHRIYICPKCSKPTYIAGHLQVPGAAYGNAVNSLTKSVGGLYEEARKCMTVSSYTAAVLACRKLLMNIAVEKGAERGKRFIEYVEYLDDKHYIPPDGRGWVDHIRTKGNEATHEIKLMEKNR